MRKPRGLIIRSRTDYNPKLHNPLTNFLLYRVFLEPAHFIMERKMLLGIKLRAEKLAHQLPKKKDMAAVDYSAGNFGHATAQGEANRPALT